MEALDDGARARLAAARLVVLSVPMHTALSLGLRVAARVRRENPSAHVCFFGLYAVLHEQLLRRTADGVLGPDCEESLVALASALERAPAPASLAARRWRSPPGRRPALVPARDALPPLARYARLAIAGERRVAGHVEATRGCKHMCRHCPIPPVYGGRFFAVPAEVVLEDARRQVAAGARHIDFGDPDFLNGPSHALRIARALHAEHPDVTFSFTAKIEHIVKQSGAVPGAGRARRPVRRERRRVALGHGAGGARQGTPRGRRARGAGHRARGRHLPAPHVRPVHPVDDARRLPGALPLHSRPRASRTRSIRSSSRSGCWSPPDRCCSAVRALARGAFRTAPRASPRSWARSTRRGSPTAGPTPIRASTAWRPRSPRSSSSRRATKSRRPRPSRASTGWPPGSRARPSRTSARRPGRVPRRRRASPKPGSAAPSRRAASSAPCEAGDAAADVERRVTVRLHPRSSGSSILGYGLAMAHLIKDKKKLVARVKRIQGQLGSVEKALESASRLRADSPDDRCVPGGPGWPDVRGFRGTHPDAHHRSRASSHLRAVEGGAGADRCREGLSEIAQRLIYPMGV